MDDWADQLQADLEKQSSARAAMLEGLFATGDYEAIRDWLEEWESEDSSPESLIKRYQARLSLRRLEYQPTQRRNLENTDAGLVLLSDRNLQPKR